MNLLKFTPSIALSLILLTASAVAQQKRPAPAKPQKEPPPPAIVAPTPPPPTFDTLLAADTYQIYGEVRSVGQFIRSSSMNEVLEPILTLADPPKELRNIVKWLNLHADEVMTSRMLVGLSPSRSGLPSTLFAIEFASAEEAAKFQQRLDAFLPKVLPTPTPTPKPSGENQTAQTTAPPDPQYYLQQAGSLIVITPAKFDLKKLRPAGSKLLLEDANFRIAYNRFNSETIFVYVDVDGIERQDEEQQRQRMAESEKENKKEPEQQRVVAVSKPPDEIVETELPTLQTTASPEPPPPARVENEPPPPARVEIGPATETKPGEIVGVAKGPAPNEAMMALMPLMSSLSSAQAKWPAGFGLALSLDGESFDVRLLLVNKPNEKGDPIPFVPALAAGPAIAPEAPGILPADTEMFVSMSLDFPQMLAVLSKPPPAPTTVRSAQTISEPQPPFAALEKLLKIKFKDDLLPLLGSEIAVSVPLSGLDLMEPPGAPPSEQNDAKPDAKESPKEPAKDTAKEKPTPRSLAVVLSLRDKEGMRALLPKLIESLAFKGANSLAQTEHRGDTELISYAKILSYAFIGDFLVISPDDATVRHIVDSHLKGETLAGEPNFKNYTRWQPRQLQGQLYISPALMEGYRKWANEPASKIDDQARALLARMSIVAQPVTYSLSNEGFGPLHELHLPKNLLLILITAVSGAVNQPETK